MGRRRTIPVNRHVDGHRASIGDNHVEAACSAIDRAFAKEADLFLPRFTAEQITPMLFRDEDVARLKAAHGLMEYTYDSTTYVLSPHIHATLQLKFHDMPAPAGKRLHWQDERVGPLLNAMTAAQELFIKWGAVKSMLRWFNRNATASAVRALWPSVMQLCPTSPALRDMLSLPSRYTNPQGISALLPLVRATASTVAAMALLPDATNFRQYTGVRLTFPSRKAFVDGVEIEVPEHSINL